MWRGRSGGQGCVCPPCYHYLNHCASYDDNQNYDDDDGDDDDDDDDDDDSVGQLASSGPNLPVGFRGP